jgi:excinuclease ABC subunit C
MSEEEKHALEDKVAAFPQLPGVYLMRSIENEVIYVGKAINLRSRVRSYLRGGDGRAQIEFLMRRLVDIEVIVTENENQAFILERDLITRYKPRYNIRLKDDRTYLSIRIDQNADWPRLEVVRKIEDDGARYFGPYSSGYEMRNLLEVIKRAIPLRTCSNTVFYNRARPCLEYQIKHCAGPCCLKVDRDDYRQWITQAIGVLEGRSDALKKQLTREMDRASEELRFEDAATYRDRLEALDSAKQSAPFVTPGGEARDVFALFREEQLACVAVLLVRNGRIIDSINYSFSSVQVGDEELIEAVVSQFYGQGRDVPDEVILPFELTNQSLLQSMLRETKAGAMEVLAPQRGIRARFLGLAELNARQHFIATFDAEKRYLEVARAFARSFKLRQMPRRIEVVDISNFQGSDIVGALVCFFEGNPDKSAYRKYRIKQQGKPDDFASIHEVVTRRLERGKLDGDLPDCLIIDGGPGQLSAALHARDELGVTLEIISLAKMRTEQNMRRKEIEKKPERMYLDPQSDPVELAADDPLTHFVARMRDEVHRFVITFHRQTRAKRVFRSVLDDVPGLGPERRRRLLKSFGSIDNIRRAEPDAIAKEGRMPLTLAQNLLRFLAEA